MNDKYVCVKCESEDFYLPDDQLCTRCNCLSLVYDLDTPKFDIHLTKLLIDNTLILIKKLKTPSNYVARDRYWLYKQLHYYISHVRYHINKHTANESMKEEEKFWVCSQCGAKHHYLPEDQACKRCKNISLVKTKPKKPNGKI